NSEDLSIVKSHAGDFTVGQQGSYDMTVTNTGSTDAGGPITVTDTLPAGLSFVSGSGSGWSCSASGQDVTCTHAATLGAGASSAITLTVDVGPAAEPSVTNIAQVSSPGSDPTPADDSASDPTTVDPSADLSLTKSHSGDFTAGGQGTYTLAVHNAGPSAAHGP